MVIIIETATYPPSKHLIASDRLTKPPRHVGASNLETFRIARVFVA